MAEIHRLHHIITPEEMLEQLLSDARGGKIKTIMVVVKDAEEIYEVWSSQGSAIEKMGMCQYASGVFLDSMVPL